MTPAILVPSIVAASLVGLAVLWWLRERARKARVAYVTRQGVTVLHPPKGATAPARDVVEMAIETALVFWWKWAGGTAYENDRQFLAGIVSRARLGWSAGPTVMCAGKPSNMAGASVPGASEVALGDPPRVVPLIIHEMGHQCLFALGVPAEKHHETFEAAGFTY